MQIMTIITVKKQLLSVLCVSNTASPFFILSDNCKTV